MSCNVCSRDSTSECERCGISYCSLVCQEEEWVLGDHKIECALIEGKREREDKTLQKYVKDNDLYNVGYLMEDIQELFSIKQKSDLLKDTRSVEMARLLVGFGADVYQYMGEGQIMLDEMSKFYNIREFLIEASEETPRRVKDLILLQRKTKRTKFQIRDIIAKKKNDDTVSIIEFRHLIYNGFFPHSASPEASKMHEDVFFRRYNITTLSYWVNVGHVKTFYTTFYSIKYFKFYTEEMMIDDAMSMSYSFPLLLSYPKSLYKDSRRPKNNMSMFGVKPSFEPFYDFKSFPVTRYGHGMSRGMFSSSNDSENLYCGTFYYLEPESRTYLLCKDNRIIYADDKIDAMNKLSKLNGFKDFKQKLEGSGRYTDLDKERMMLTPDEYFNKYKKYWDDSLRSRYDPDNYQNTLQRNRKYYYAHVEDLYASQDEWDQPLCVLARTVGIDVVVLKYMEGSRQIVTEILDTRKRQISFDHLYYKTKYK